MSCVPCSLVGDVYGEGDGANKIRQKMVGREYGGHALINASRAQPHARLLDCTTRLPLPRRLLFTFTGKLGSAVSVDLRN